MNHGAQNHLSSPYSARSSQSTYILNRTAQQHIAAELSPATDLLRNSIIIADMSSIIKAIASAVTKEKIDPNSVEEKIAETQAYYKKKQEERRARDKAYWETVEKLTPQFDKK